MIVSFHDRRAELARRMPQLRALMEPAAGLWIAWPKRASGVATDLTEDVVRELALANRARRQQGLRDRRDLERPAARDPADGAPVPSPMTDPLPEDQRLAEISPKAYEHPADRAATAALKCVPMLDTVVRKLIEFGYERALRQQLPGRLACGSAPTSCPTSGPTTPRRATRGSTSPRSPTSTSRSSRSPTRRRSAPGSPMVVVNSRTVELLDEHELRTVLGHEAGHILSDHVLYRTALMILLSAHRRWRGCPCSPGLPLLAVRLALLEWFRAAELSLPTARRRSSTATRW